MGFRGGSLVKSLPANGGDVGLTSGLDGFPGEENGNPLQNSCLGNPMDRGAWWATVCGGHKRTGHDLATKQQHQQIMQIIHDHVPEWMFLREGKYPPSSFRPMKSHKVLTSWSLITCGPCICPSSDSYHNTFTTCDFSSLFLLSCIPFSILPLPSIPCTPAFPAN